MNFLLDTCIVSELTRSVPSPSVISWLSAQDPESLYLSCLTIGELRKGIAKRNGDALAVKLAKWLNDVILTRFADRILPLGIEEAGIWGTLCGESEHAGRKRPVIDSLIASTALFHNMTLVTRNISDMTGFGVTLLNPFSPANSI